MRKWLAIFFFVVLIVSCFFPWVVIESRGLVITGMNAESINFGKPAYVHFVLSGLILLLLLVHRAWSLVTAFFLGGFNIAWAIRNYISLSACGDVCPTRQPALYLMVFSAIAGVVCILLAGNSLNSKKA